MPRRARSHASDYEVTSGSEGSRNSPPGNRRPGRRGAPAPECVPTPPSAGNDAQAALSAHFADARLPVWDTELKSTYAPMHPCKLCGCLLFKKESKTMCCAGGSRIITAAHMDWWDAPSPERDALLKLYDMPKVQNRSRAYNNLFTFTAMKHDITHPTGQGVGMLRMGGRTLHYQKCVSEMNTLQWYLHDPVERFAAAQNQKLDQGVVRSMAAIIEQINVHSKRLCSERDAMLARGHPLEDLHVELMHAPNCCEMAPLSRPDRAANAGHQRNVVITHKNTGEVKKVSILSSLYEPLQYPLFFPTGDHGWGLPGKGAGGEDASLTQLMYYKHMLLRDVVQMRVDVQAANNVAQAAQQYVDNLQRHPTVALRDSQVFGPRRFGRLGRLFNEYLLDMHSRLEESNLQFHNRNQRLICKYVDADRTMDDMEAAGRRILAASFAGGLRYMREKCTNAYALRMKHGIPDVFVTFTCNPEVRAI